MATFKTKKELKEFIRKSIPIAVRPVRKAKTIFVAPFRSANAERLVIDSIVDDLWEEINKNK